MSIAQISVSSGECGLKGLLATQTPPYEHPIRLLVATAAVAVVMTIISEYQTGRTDQANFVVFVNIPDVYGNMEAQQLFSFDFNRKLFDRVNWDNFEFANLARIAPHFKLSPWLVENWSELKGRRFALTSMNRIVGAPKSTNRRCSRK